MLPAPDPASPPPRPDGPELWRVFYAVSVSPEVRAALAEVAGRLQGAARFFPLSASWVAPEKYHLTLHFLGPVPRATAESLAEDLPRLARLAPAFEMDVRHLGYFPHDKAPRVLWAGVHRPPEALAQLREVLAKGILRQDLEVPHDNFHAHVTLARFKNLRGTAGLVKTADTYRHAHFGVTPVREVVLMRSMPPALGGHYEVIGSGELESAQGGEGGA